MNEPKLCGRLLTQLFRRGQTNESISVINLAEACGASPHEALKALSALDSAGLCDARRLRLTLSGLALAAAFSEPSRQARSTERPPGRPLSKTRHAA
jgi:Mn-dependent DtxR family transcriptional regulator